MYTHFKSFRAKSASALSCTRTAAGKSLSRIRHPSLFQSCHAAFAIDSCFVFRRARLAAACCGCNNYSHSEGGQRPALHAGAQLSCCMSAASLRHSAPHLRGKAAASLQQQSLSIVLPQKIWRRAARARSCALSRRSCLPRRANTRQPSRSRIGKYLGFTVTF